MFNNIIIDVNNISMRFKMADGNIRSIKEYLVKLFSRKLNHNRFDVLNNISFKVKKGEVIGIIGENGAGKSTMLKIISGILKPTKGKVTVSGNIVPMLELGCGFDAELTGKENIYLNAAILGYDKAFIDEKYNEIVEFSELGNFIYQPLRTYSSGMMMRLGFSIAAVVKPEILIIDEILAVGDDRFQIKSYNKIMQLINSGATVIFVSHNIEAIKKLCDRVVWLENGILKMIGDADKVATEYSKR